MSIENLHSTKSEIANVLNYVSLLNLSVTEIKP